MVASPANTCGCVAAAATIVAAKWTPQLIYSLSNGIGRFCELQKAAGGINPRTLSSRLDELEQTGIIEKQAVSAMAPHITYGLTDKGRDLVPILEQMVRWGDKYTPEKTAIG